MGDARRVLAQGEQASQRAEGSHLSKGKVRCFIFSVEIIGLGRGHWVRNDGDGDGGGGGDDDGAGDAGDADDYDDG